MKKIEIKLTPKQIKISLYITIFVIIVATLYYISIFLYKNFYLVITQSEEIMVLQKKSKTGTVDTEKFDKIMREIEEKGNKNYSNQTNPNNATTNNPFK